MKPDIKAMLAELPAAAASLAGTEYFKKQDIEAWLDKLAEGARDVYGNGTSGDWSEKTDGSAPVSALLICPREIKKQAPLEIAVEKMREALVYYSNMRYDQTKEQWISPGPSTASVAVAFFDQAKIEAAT